MKTLRHNYSPCFLLLLTACAKEPPPVSVTEFMENPRLLEATMVRCAANRAELKYEPNCVNARDAVDRLEVREKEARKAELEAMSERKRRALRRTQQAAAEARKRSLEFEKQKEAAEYLGVSEDQLAAEPPTEPDEPPPAESNVPGVQIAPPGTDDAGEGSSIEPESTASDVQPNSEDMERHQEDPR